LLYDATL
jgi:hypothetical protein